MRPNTELARITADVKAGRVQRVMRNRFVHQQVMGLIDLAGNGPLVDATFIYDTYLARDAVAIYEDHPDIRPPWSTAWVGYQNEHGNSLVSLVVATDWEDGFEWESEHDNSFDGARWRYHVWTFIGGHGSDGSRLATSGPVTMTRVAVHEDGHPLEIGWVDLLGNGRAEEWDWSRWTMLGVYTLLNCRNVEIVESALPRALRRREERYGVRSHTVVISLSGQQSSSTSQPDGGAALIPLSTVRGHPAHYGNCCPSLHEPKGLLFGKLEGKIWVPQYARGSEEVGVVDQSFVLQRNRVKKGD